MWAELGERVPESGLVLGFRSDWVSTLRSIDNSFSVLLDLGVPRLGPLPWSRKADIPDYRGWLAEIRSAAFHRS
jgi:hypothetical protein